MAGLGGERLAADVADDGPEFDTDVAQRHRAAADGAADIERIGAAARIRQEVSLTELSLHGAGGRFTQHALRFGAWCALAVFVHVGFAAQTAGQIQQARLNLRFARDPSFLHALERYEPMWPPLYPTLLWSLDRLGIGPLVVNELLVFASLLLLWRLARRVAPGVDPFVPVLLFAVMQANYWNLHLVVSEALLVPLVLASSLALLRFQERRDWTSLLLLAALLSAACATRTIALFWLIPLFAWFAWPQARDLSLAKRIAATAVVLAPTLVWMAHAYRTTGFLTGRNRLNARQWDSAIRHWEGTTDLPHNAWFALKTLAADFFSPLHFANHPFVDFPWHPTAIEWLCLVAAIGTIAWIAADRLRGRSRSAPWQLVAREPEMLPIQLVLAFLFWTLALWSVGNNDPIYTRFLYPSYAFIILATCRAFGRTDFNHRSVRLAFELLAVSFAGVQLYKTLLLPA